jgi:hypothetical protein
MVSYHLWHLFAQFWVGVLDVGITHMQVMIDRLHISHGAKYLSGPNHLAIKGCVDLITRSPV